MVGDRYIVFPHLEPFADPARLSAPEITDSLYRTPVYLLLTEGPPSKFALRLRYDASGGGDRSTLSLNALQVREGSEQLFIGGRKLERDVDYRISYEVGQVTFINPDLLFGQGSAQVTARFEERGIFAVAPTTILGMSTRYSLGDRGAINLIGMYQREQSAFTRPALGFEATANLIGGVNTELHFRPQGITRFLNSLTSSSTTAPSLFDVNAEFAFTKPDANRSGEAYLEEFESEAGLQVPMREAQWEFGSLPESAAGLEDIGFAAFDPADAVQLIWQNLVPISRVQSPAAGVAAPGHRHADPARRERRAGRAGDVSRLCTRIRRAGSSSATTIRAGRSRGGISLRAGAPWSPGSVPPASISPGTSSWSSGSSSRPASRPIPPDSGWSSTSAR